MGRGPFLTLTESSSVTGRTVSLGGLNYPVKSNSLLREVVGFFSSSVVPVSQASPPDAPPLRWSPELPAEFLRTDLLLLCRYSCKNFSSSSSICFESIWTSSSTGVLNYIFSSSTMVWMTSSGLILSPYYSKTSLKSIMGDFLWSVLLRLLSDFIAAINRLLCDFSSSLSEAGSGSLKVVLT
jgi:hypothetical protein